MDTALEYLHALAYDDNDLRLQARFRSYPRTGDNDFLRMNNELSFAYLELFHGDVNEALAHLESVRDICTERLSDVYRQKRARCVVLLRRLTRDRTSTAPVLHDEDLNVRMLLTELKTLSGSPTHATMQTPRV
jgi:hypothetical protein